jgi:hypothetical protein
LAFCTVSSDQLLNERQRMHWPLDYAADFRPLYFSSDSFGNSERPRRTHVGYDQNAVSAHCINLWMLGDRFGTLLGQFYFERRNAE